MDTISQEDKTQWLSLVDAHITNLEAHHLILEQAATLIAQNGTTDAGSAYRDEMTNMVNRAGFVLGEARRAKEMVNGGPIPENPVPLPTPVHNTASFQVPLRNKRRPSEPTSFTQTRRSKRRRRQTNDTDFMTESTTVPLGAPDIEYEDISTEVNARLRAKEEKRKRKISGGGAGSKRKRRSSGDSMMQLVSDGVDGLTVSEGQKPAKKKMARNRTSEAKEGSARTKRAAARRARKRERRAQEVSEQPAAQSEAAQSEAAPNGV